MTVELVRENRTSRFAEPGEGMNTKRLAALGLIGLQNGAVVWDDGTEVKPSSEFSQAGELTSHLLIRRRARWLRRQFRLCQGAAETYAHAMAGAHP